MINLLRSLRSLVLLMSMMLLAQVGWGQISISSGSAVTENFNGIGISSTASLPTNWKMSAAASGSSTLSYLDATNVTATTAAASTGSPTTGGRYNWGDGTTTSDRSIGFMTSGSYSSPNSILTWYRNTSGVQINDLSISFDFERYRVNTATCSVAFYTSTNGTSWTARTSGDISTSVFASGTASYTFTGGTTSSKTVTLTGINIANNSDLYLMWVITNTGSSNSQGIGLDNVSLTATLAAGNTNYYLKSGGSVSTLADWGTNAAGTTGGPAPALNTANINWNIANSDVTLDASWTLGSNSKIVVGDGSVARNFTIPSGFAVAGSVDVSAGATLTVSNTINPTLGTLNATSTVVFNASSAQTIPAATYGNLTVSTTGGDATAGGNVVLAATSTLTVSSGSTLDLVTYTLTGGGTLLTTSGTGTIKTQNTTSTPIPASKTWAMTLKYNSASGQTVVAGTYANLDISGGNRTLINGGTINISGTYTPGNGTLTVPGNTINFNGADGQAIPGATYNTLTSSNNTRSLSGTIKIAGTFTPGSGNYTIGTSTVEFNGSSAQTIPVLSVSSGSNYYNLTYSGSSTGTISGSSTLSIGGALTVSSGTLNLNATSTTRTLNVTGNFVQSGGTLDGGSVNTASGPTSTINLSGNFSKSSGSFTNTASTTSFTLNFGNSGSQSFTNSGTFTYANININSGSILTALSDIPNANGVFTVNGTLDLDAFQITNLYSSSVVTINGVLKTKKSAGLSDSPSTTSSAISSTNTTIALGANSTIEYNASSTQTLTSRADYGNLTLTGGSKTAGTASSQTIVVAKTFTINSGASYNGGTNNPALNVAGNFVNSGTFTQGTGLVTFNGSSAQTFTQTGSGSLGNVVMNNASGVTANNNFAITGSLTLTSGTLDLASNVLTYSGSSISSGGGSIDADAGGIIFSNVAGITLPSAAISGIVKDLTINGAGGVTLGSNQTVTGSLTLTSGTLDLSNKILTYSGSPIIRNSGVVDADAGGVIFTNTTAVTLPASVFSGNVNNCTMNGSGGITIEGNQTIAGTLTLTAGIISLGNNTLTLSGSLSGGSSGSYVRTNGSGSFVVNSISTTGRLFPIGNTTYNPITIANGSGYNWSARVEDAVNNVQAPFDFTKAVLRTWHIAPSTNPPTSGADITFQYDDGDAPQLGTNYSKTENLQLWHYGSFWTSAGTAMTPTGTANGVRTVTQTGLTRFSPYALTNVTGPLPATLLSFSGYKDGFKNQLRWVTATETNNRGFQIERSSDGQNYQSIGFVNSLAIGGNSQTLLKYSFADANPAGIKQYYRLKQTDIDGRNTLSNILLIQNEKPKSLEIASAFPNPSNGQLTLLLSAPDNRQISIRLFDMAGRLLETRSVNVLSGNNSIAFDLSKQPKGQYLIQAGEKTIRVGRE